LQRGAHCALLDPLPSHIGWLCQKVGNRFPPPLDPAPFSRFHYYVDGVAGKRKSKNIRSMSKEDLQGRVVSGASRVTGLVGRPSTAKRERLSRWNIGHELFLLVFVVLLPFTGLGVYWAVEDYRAEQARIQARALRLAREVRNEVDQFIADTSALVEGLARVPSVKRGEQPESNHLLSELAERHPSYESLFAIDTDGRLLAAGGEDVLPPGNRLTYVGRTLEIGSTLVTEPIAPRNSGRQVFVVATALFNDAGEPIGIVGASVNLLRLQEGMRRVEVPENSSLLIVNQNTGRIVARRIDPELWVGRSALESGAVRDALRRREGVSEGDFLDGIRRLSGFAPTRRVAWQVIVGIPTDEAYGALRRELWRGLARVALVGTVAGIVAWVLSRRLTRPIGELAAAGRAYASGELSHRTSIDGPEELAALGATLNRMASAIQAQMAQLREARAREREAGERAIAELQRLHSEFIAVAAHELRTPVAAVKSYAELLMRPDVDLSPTIQRQALVRLDHVCERLSRLVRSLLGASRLQAGRLDIEPEPLDLSTITERILEQVTDYTPGHDLRLLVAPGGSTLALADAERVEDVLVNLLANASKYSPGGTTILVNVLGKGDVVEVSVTDEGPGIPVEEQAAIFERFRRGKGVAASGVGLGLYIARAYVQAMGGQIGVRSEPGQGATFWFHLPAAPTSLPPSDQTGAAGQGDSDALDGAAQSHEVAEYLFSASDRAHPSQHVTR
jgi:signal transduction histidine kinase